MHFTRNQSRYFSNAPRTQIFLFLLDLWISDHSTETEEQKLNYYCKNMEDEYTLMEEPYGARKVFAEK